MSIIVTGGAGFIGSCVVGFLNNIGREDIIIVDNISSTEKWINLRNKKFIDYVHKSVFMDSIESYKDLEAIIHMGACSSTTEKNFDYLFDNNFRYTKRLWDYCSDHHIQFIYASSAATYGDGSNGFDDKSDIDELQPLNAYGYSKQRFDQWVKHHAKNFPKQNVGLKFFNVYGPNEYCKGSMASMVYHGYCQIKQNGEIRLFKSYKKGYEDGMQLRDFVYVKDVCNVILWFLDHPDKSGIYNIGTGVARSFVDLAVATFSALKLPVKIRYIDMPDKLKERYQYYTKAQMDKLYSIGYDNNFCSIEDGVKDYVSSYLDKGFAVM